MRKMRATAGWLAAVLLTVAVGNASAQGISGTPHDLSGLTGATDETCVFCHTPHAALDTVEAPLWNKPAQGTSYTTYDSTTIDGAVLAVGSVSFACLSCHDGTQARDAVINAPGTGAGAGFIGGGTTTTGPIGGGIANLGADLSNDHPIGIQYGGYTISGASAQIDPDFVVPQTIGAGTTQRWWVDVGVAAAGAGARTGLRDKTDMILYTRQNGAETEPFVECGSCHDPHDATKGTFLRIANAASNVCLACHVK